MSAGQKDIVADRNVWQTKRGVGVTRQYGVLVVDDEPVAADAICRVIERSCPGFRVEGKTENGEEALKMAERIIPDLVITDIDMPLMSGLEFAKEMKKKQPDTCFVIVSGYQDFVYMREAIQIGVLDYISKPIVPSVIKRTMDRVEQKIKEIHYQKRNMLLKKLCCGGEVSESEFGRYFPHDIFYCALLRENGLPGRFTLQTGREIYEDIHEQFSAYGRDDREEFFLIPSELLGTVTIKDYIEKIAVRRQKKSSYITVLYDAQGIPAANVRERIRRIYDALNANSVIGCSRFVDVGSDEWSKAKPDTEEDRRFSKALAELECMLERRNFEKAELLLKEWYRRWGEECRPQLWVEAVSRRVLDLIRKKTRDTMPFSERESMFEDAFFYASSMEGLAENLCGIFSGMWKKERQTRVDSEEFFAEVESYLNDHLSEELSLSALSDVFSVSQTSMSRLFRKYGKKSYSQYLLGLRMERGKELLLDEKNYLIKDIAEMLGYTDQFYFSRIFRAYTGVCPSDYVKIKKEE